MLLYATPQPRNPNLVFKILKRVCFTPPRTSARSQLHSALSNLAVIAMLGGLYAIYSNKEKMGKPHWTSWHSWVGVSALVLWVANVAVAAAHTADLEKKRLVFLWKSRKHR